MDTPCCLTAAASAASVPCAQSSLRDLSESRFHPQACAGLSLGEMHNSNIYTQVFYFDKREAGFLIFIEGCKHECYPKVHQNIHSVQTCVWISNCGFLAVNQEMYLFNCAGQWVPKACPLCKTSLQMSLLGAFYFSACRQELVAIILFQDPVFCGSGCQKSQSGKEAPGLYFCSVGRNKERNKEEHGSSSAQLWQDFTCVLCVAVAACACKDSRLGRHDLAPFL